MPQGSSQTYAPTDAPASIHLAYVLAYRAPQYIRSQSILKAIGNDPAIVLSIARNRSTGLWRYIQTWHSLVRIRKASPPPDIYVLGFRGHEIFWPIRWLTRGKPLIIDALMSPSIALKEEGKAGLFGHVVAPLLRHLEKGILRHANLVLTDTALHADLYEKEFGLTKEKILALPVGAVEPGFSTCSTAPFMTNDPSAFNVLFFGSMLPLHGIDIIVSAAAKLRDLPIRFDFIGGNTKQASRLKNLCAEQGVTRYTHRCWVPLDELVARDIPHASLCLGGPFGGTPQARRVITGKTSQCLALGKATIIGDIDENTGFQDKSNCLLVPQADTDALADAIRWGFFHQDALHDIGKHGRMLYHNRLSVDTITEKLVPAIKRLCTFRQSQA